jgi:DNA-binding MarR family transcriptional regulator
MPASPRPARVSQAEYEVLAAFRQALLRFLSFSQAAARGAGLTTRQHQALLAVRGAPGGEQLSIGALADRLSIRHHSAVGLVDRLVALGLLARRRDAADRRRVHLVLTARGRRSLESLAAAHREELRRVGPRLRSLLDGLRGGQRGPQAN